jgi:hypothetical protein
VNYFKDKILPSLLTAILLAILTAVVKIYLTVETIPDKFDDNKIQHQRYDELLQQEIEKRVAIEKELIKIQTKLEKPH